MVRKKFNRWNKFAVAGVLALVFTISGLIVLTPNASADATFNWTNSTTIHGTGVDSSVPGSSDMDFSCTGSNGKYTCTHNASGGCKFIISIDSSSTSGTLQTPDYVNRSATCYGSDTSNITIGSTDNAPTELADTTSTTDDDNSDADPELNCTADASSLKWIICPVVYGINKGVSLVDGWIRDLLYIDQKKIFDTTTTSGKGYYAAWQAFRGLAVAVLVIAGLVMVISHGLGFEVLDAYTIRKVLPRLIFAVIGLTLSWQLMEFFVVFTNDLGIGVQHIIYYPFKNVAGGANIGDGTAILAALLTVGAAVAMTLVAVGSLAITAILAALIAFLVLVLRQIIIVVLIIFAPIAIACSVLPNTQGIWKLWHESFTKGLLMFPIIMAFLAVGRVFAITSMGGAVGKSGTMTDAGISPLSQIIGLIAYFLPYFLIPLTFRFAGGALRTVGGMVNDRSRGGFDRLKKFRAAKTAESFHKMKEGNRYRGNNGLARGFNTASHNVAMAPQAGLSPSKMRSRFTAAKSQHAFDAAEEIRTKNADFAAGAQDDRILKAVQHGRGRADIQRRLMAEGITNPAELNNAVGIAERMQATGSREAVEQAAAMQRFATGTGYNDTNGNFDFAEAANSIRDASGGDRALAGRILGMSKGVAGQAGQQAWGGASYGTLNTALQQSFDGQTVNGNRVALDAFMGSDAVSAARAREPHLRAMMNAANERVVELSNTPNPSVEQRAELGRLTQQVEAYQGTVGMYGAPGRQNIANASVVTSEIERNQVVNAANARLTQEQSGQALPPRDPMVDQNIRARPTRGADPRDRQMFDRDQDH